MRKDDKMNDIEKKEIIGSIVELLERLIDDKESGKAKSQPVEMLTIKECASAVSGLSEHTVRKLVAQGKVKSIRTGEGKRGKILVNKADLINYFQR